MTDIPPGGYVTEEGTVQLNEGRETETVGVSNTGDRPVQVGSHFHFFEVNKALAFDRTAAYGKRLDVPAGTAVRFEPGETKEVELVAVGGKRRVTGLNRLTEGSVAGGAGRDEAVGRARKRGYSDTGVDG
jgi:urease subunit beta